MLSRLENFTVAEVVHMIVEHRCPEKTHVECPDYNSALLLHLHCWTDPSAA